jgi:hypothetical protein
VSKDIAEADPLNDRDVPASTRSDPGPDKVSHGAPAGIELRHTIQETASTLALAEATVDQTEVAGVEVEMNPCRQLAIHMKREIERIISLSDPYDPST